MRGGRGGEDNGDEGFSQVAAVIIGVGRGCPQHGAAEAANPTREKKTEAPEKKEGLTTRPYKARARNGYRRPRTSMIRGASRGPAEAGQETQSAFNESALMTLCHFVGIGAFRPEHECGLAE